AVPDLPFLAIVLGIDYAAVRIASAPDASATAAARPSRAFLLGIAGGLAFLTRFNFAIWIPLYAFYLRRRGLRFALAAAAGFALALAPALALIYANTGTFSLGPYASWNLPVGTSAAASPEPWREFRTFSVLGIILHHGSELLAKGASAFATELL